MSMTVETVMRSIHNFFETGYIRSTFTIDDGALSPSEVFREGTYIAIEGSYYHDGVWKIGSGFKLEDVPKETPSETFTGRVWFLHPPISFLNLCSEIADFDLQNPAGANKSESLGSYTYTRETAENGLVMTWQSAFATRLASYRRMFTEVCI